LEEKMKHNILVIEESSSALRKRIVSALTNGRFETVTAASCEEALSRLGEGELEPQLIILGETPTAVDNFQDCSQLRQVVDVPILMLGTAPGNQAWTSAVSAGADFYLMKPFGFLELVARVEALIRRYQQTDSNIRR